MKPAPVHLSRVRSRKRMLGLSSTGFLCATAIGVAYLLPVAGLVMSQATAKLPPLIEDERAARDHAAAMEKSLCPARTAGIDTP